MFSVRASLCMEVAVCVCVKGSLDAFVMVLVKEEEEEGVWMEAELPVRLLYLSVL